MKTPKANIFCDGTLYEKGVAYDAKSIKHLDQNDFEDYVEVKKPKAVKAKKDPNFESMTTETFKKK